MAAACGCADRGPDTRSSVAYDAWVWIDLNADVGEGFDGADQAILPLVSSANIACGGHAGDADSMRRTVGLAMRHGVAIGAHPGYPDPEGFGRREFQIDGPTLRTSLLGQLEALAAVVAVAGGSVGHVKPHGALYGRAAADRALADLVAQVVQQWRPKVAVVGPPGSRLLEAAVALGLTTLAEAFADRAYQADGSLRPRSLPGALIDDPRTAASQAVAIAIHGRAPLDDGGTVPVAARTLCLHGDAPGAPERAAAVRAALLEAGVNVRARGPVG